MYLTQGNVVQFKSNSEDSILPAKAHADDACFDLYSSEHWSLTPGGTKAINTGYDIALPPGHVGLVCSRSGLAAKHGVFVLNAPGVVDAGYRGPLKVVLHNTTNQIFNIQPGDRIGQLLVQKVLPIAVFEVEEFDDETERGTKGFGSTGR